VVEDAWMDSILDLAHFLRTLHRLQSDPQTEWKKYTISGKNQGNQEGRDDMPAFRTSNNS
jgi:hypothetical protein